MIGRLSLSIFLGGLLWSHMVIPAGTPTATIQGPHSFCLVTSPGAVNDS